MLGRIGISRRFGLRGGAAGRAGTSNPKNTILAAPASFVLTGQSAGLVYGRTALVAALGTFALTGQAAALTAQRSLTAAQGTFVQTGQDASISKAAPGAYSLSAATGAFVLTGDAMTPVVDYKLPVDLGAIALMGMAASLTKAGGSTSYVTGNRVGSIVVTCSQPDGQQLLNGQPNALIDGSMADDQNGSAPYGATYFNYRDPSPAAEQQIIFDFGTAKVVDEAKWYQSAAYEQGTWQWCGSTDGTTLSATIGAPFTLGGGEDGFPTTHTTLNGNTTAYRYYILNGVAGDTSHIPYIREIEFKQN